MGDVRSAIFLAYRGYCSELPTPPAGHNSNRTYTPTVKPNGPLTHPARSPGFTVLPRTTGQPYQSRSHAP